jgi:hypothetical protein
MDGNEHDRPAERRGTPDPKEARAEPAAETPAESTAILSPSDADTDAGQEAGYGFGV